MRSADKSTVVCTLFEGDYHHGVATLVNSLVNAGFCGKIFVGYRGILPDWAIVPNDICKNTIDLPTGGSIEFIKIETDWHLTNYKPVFIISLMNGDIYDAEYVFYFDPDIIIRGYWSFFEKWATFGIALCEDVNSPMSSRHPKRYLWKELFPDLIFTDTMGCAYINAGFIGISKAYMGFLRHWKSIIERATEFTGGPSNWYNTSRQEPSSPFSAFDQDALNVALMTSDVPISTVGPEGMDFKGGGFLMSHAIGPQKPWRRTNLGLVLSGIRPGVVQNEYVRNMRGVVVSTTYSQYLLRRIDLLLAKTISRLIA